MKKLRHLLLNRKKYLNIALPNEMVLLLESSCLQKLVILVILATPSLVPF